MMLKTTCRAAKHIWRATAGEMCKHYNVIHGLLMETIYSIGKYIVYNIGVWIHRRIHRACDMYMGVMKPITCVLVVWIRVYVVSSGKCRYCVIYCFNFINE